MECKSIMWILAICRVERAHAIDRRPKIKSHLKSYVNEGHSVMNVRELKQAIESREGIPGVCVTVVKVHNRSSKSYKFDGISSLNNFKFTNGGFTAFHAYNIGPGKFFPRSLFESGIV